MNTLMCAECQNSFSVSGEERYFLDFFKMPDFKKCYPCRRKHRLAFVNYTTFYKRKNDAPNSKNYIISAIDEKAPFPVYDFDYYTSDNHVPENFNIEYDKNQSFFDNFYELFKKCPQPALNQNLSNIDSPYLNYGAYMKNAYYSFGGMASEDVAYSMWSLKTKDSHDCLIPLESEKIYEGVFSEKCFNSNFVYFSKNCLDSNFIYDCRNCSNCFGCVNLRNKKYCIFNEQFTESEYKEKIKELDLTNSENLNLLKENFFKFVNSMPLRASHNEHSLNSTGIFLLNCKNTNNAVWNLQTEDCFGTEFAMSLKHSCDVTITSNSSNLFNTVVCGEQSFDVRNSLFCRSSSNIDYSMNLRDCKNCFACIGLRNKEYYIFNQPYSKEQYELRVSELKQIMLKEGVYGDFFPLFLSPFAYNATLAGLYDSREEGYLIGQGTRFVFPEVEKSVIENAKKISDLPKNLNQLQMSDFKNGLIGFGINRPFLLREEDLIFYQKQKVYIPTFHPFDRFKARFNILNNFEINNVECKKCGIKVKSMLSSDCIIYCDECYKKEYL